MDYINPKSFAKYGLDKEAENVLKQLNKYGRAISHDIELTRLLGKSHRNLLDKNLLDVATTRYNKRDNKTLFSTPFDVIVTPKITKNGVNFHFKRHNSHF